MATIFAIARRLSLIYKQKNRKIRQNPKRENTPKHINMLQIDTRLNLEIIHLKPNFPKITNIALSMIVAMIFIFLTKIYNHLHYNSDNTCKICYYLITNHRYEYQKIVISKYLWIIIVIIAHDIFQGSQLILFFNQLIQYFPPILRQSYDQLQRTQRNTSIAFWTIDLLIVATCHRIPIVSRIFSNKWAMFFLKASLVAIPYYTMQMLDAQVNKEFNKSFYNAIKSSYKNYKRSGDILDLNPAIKLIDEPIQWNPPVENISQQIL